MRKFTKVVAGALAGCMVAAGCLALAGCGGSSSQQADYKLLEDGKLTVITSADYPPMESLENGEIVGFDPALINAIGEKLGLEVEIKNQAFDSLVTAIAGGSTADVAISAITIDDERAKEVDFTNSYYDSNLAVVVLADSELAAKEDLNAAEFTVGAQSGSSGEAWAKENLKDAKYVQYQETPDLLAALRTGKIQAAIYDDPVAEAHVSGEYTDCKVLEVIPTGEQYGIIVNKDNAALTEDINSALADLTSDGTMDTLLTEYLG